MVSKPEKTHRQCTSVVIVYLWHAFCHDTRGDCVQMFIHWGYWRYWINTCYQHDVLSHCQYVKGLLKDLCARNSLMNLSYAIDVNRQFSSLTTMRKIDSDKSQSIKMVITVTALVVPGCAIKWIYVSLVTTNADDGYDTNSDISIKIIPKNVYRDGTEHTFYYGVLIVSMFYVLYRVIHKSRKWILFKYKHLNANTKKWHYKTSCFKAQTKSKFNITMCL